MHDSPNQDSTDNYSKKQFNSRTDRFQDGFKRNNDFVNGKNGMFVMN